MQQKKMKTLTLALIVILALALALAFVACNPNNDNNSTTPGGNSGSTTGEQGTNPGEPTETPGEQGTDPEPTETPATGLAKIWSEQQFNSLVGYLYSADVNGNGESGVYIYYFNAEITASMLEYNKPLGDLKLQNGFVTATINIRYGEYDEENYSYSDKKTIVISYLSTPEEANAVLEATKNGKWDSAFEIDPKETKIAHTFGNVAVLESEEGLYESMLASKIPSTVSAARKDMLKQSFDKVVSDNYVGYGMISVKQSTTDEQTTQIADSSYFYYMPLHGNCNEDLGFTFTNDQDSIKYEKEAWAEDKIFFTEDSYLNDTKEEAYIFRYSKYKPGFVYKKYESGDEVSYIIDNYMQTEDVVENVVIPAELYGHKIKSVDIYCMHAKNVTISEGIKSVYLGHNHSDNKSCAIQSITLPSSLEICSIYSSTLETVTMPDITVYFGGCPALKTINYGGSTADFENRYGNKTDAFCHMYVGLDETTYKEIYTDISISVVCNDGTLTCTKDGIQRN